MTDNIIVFEKDEIPSKSFSLSIKKPLYGDYREARKLYPVTNSQTDRPPYSVEELLLARSIVAINGQELPVEPRNVIDRLASWDLADRQFITLAFVSGLFLGPDDAKEARQLAQNLQAMEYSDTYTIPRNRIPTQSIIFTFNRPNTGSQMAAERRFQGPEINGCTLEELLFAMCLTQINGNPVQHPLDIVSILDNHEIVDVQYASVLFVNSFLLDDTGAEGAKDLGKQKFRKSGPEKPATKSKGTSRQPAE